MRFPILDSIAYSIKHIQIQNQEKWCWEKKLQKESQEKERMQIHEHQPQLVFESNLFITQK